VKSSEVLTEEAINLFREATGRFLKDNSDIDPTVLAQTALRAQLANAAVIAQTLHIVTIDHWRSVCDAIWPLGRRLFSVVCLSMGQGDGEGDGGN